MTDQSTTEKTAVAGRAVRRARTTGAAMPLTATAVVFTETESARRA